MAKPRYKSKHSGTARNTLPHPNHVPAPTTGIAPTNTARQRSTPGSLPQPFNPHIFRRLTIASGTTASPIHANPTAISTSNPPFNSPHASITPIQNTPAAGAGSPSKCVPPSPLSAATLNRANRYAAADATPGSVEDLAVKDFRAWLHGLFARLVAEAGHPATRQLTTQLVLLYDGANIAAALDGDPLAATAARAAASALLGDDHV